MPVPRVEASAFGVIHTAADGRGIEAFLEKPADPPGLPGRPDETYASMGNYVFSTEALLDALVTDAADENSKHDMGGNIVPMLVGQNAAQVYDYQSNVVPGEEPGAQHYWRDVGTLDSYFDAHMDLCATVPAFNLYNPQWPILTHIPSHPPAKFVHDDGDRIGHAIDSVVSNGVIVSGATVRESVLSPGVRVHSWAAVDRSVVLDGVTIGRRAVVRDAILDKNVVVGEGVEIGVNKDDDRARGFVVSDARRDRAGQGAAGRQVAGPRRGAGWLNPAERRGTRLLPARCCSDSPLLTSKRSRVEPVDESNESFEPIAYRVLQDFLVQFRVLVSKHVPHAHDLRPVWCFGVK